jgi:catechol 2,3-dioxygenase-like lactoylglutathione lyase family enzyme
MSTDAFVGTIMIDCNDIETMTTFWSRALGLDEEVRYPNYVWLSRLGEKGPALAFQLVPEPRQGKNRIHLDIGAEDPEAFVAHIIELGGAKIEDHEVNGFRWSILADPEGNLFCVTPAGH